jgi:hypothetical protein
MTTVSRDMIRAILEARDHKHDETHAILVAMFQGLVAELVEQGVLAPEPLAERLALASSRIDEDPYGTGARTMLTHVVSWLRDIQTGLPPAHPDRWYAPLPPDD